VKPLELDNEQGQAIRETMSGADAGDTAGLKGLLNKDRGLSRSEYWYQHSLHYAVLGGHLEAREVTSRRRCRPAIEGPLAFLYKRR
jgi:hypothetical protein